MKDDKVYVNEKIVDPGQSGDDLEAAIDKREDYKPCESISKKLDKIIDLLNKISMKR